MPKSAIWFPLIVFGILRLFLTGWAGLQLTINPLPPTPDELLRPYLGTDILNDGFLDPWQRFDSNRYVRIAMQGYAHEEDSVFPPLYPLMIRSLATVVPALSPTARHLSAALFISNLACLICFGLFYHLAQQKIGTSAAKRALIYFAIFPTSFFLLAAYTEPLFILFAISTLWAAEKEQWLIAALCAFLATLTRTTGLLLFVPLFYVALTPSFRLRPLLSSFAPILAFGLFLAYRHQLDLSPINHIYSRYWYQTTSFPGHDLWTAIQIMLTGQGVRAGELTLWLDFLVVFLLALGVWTTFRRFGGLYGWYVAMMLLFMLLPRSDLKPLYSFTRYALAFFPLFWGWGSAGTNPWFNRLILYPCLLLYLYLSGQFFIWGWVA